MDQTETGPFYWCMRHKRVEQAGQACPEDHRLGPYPTAAAAHDWRQRHEGRKDRWEAQDKQWEGDR